MKNIDKVSIEARNSMFWNKQELDDLRKDYLDNVKSIEQWYKFLQENNYTMALYATSSYPIDYSKIDYPISKNKFVYQNVAKVSSLNFDQLDKKIHNDTIGINSANSKVCPTRVKNFSHELEFLEKLGFKAGGHVIRPPQDEYPELYDLVQKFDFDHYLMQVRIQYPGSVQAAHTDALDCFWGDLLNDDVDVTKLPFDPVTKSPEGYYAIRLIVALDDYEPGQVFGFEDRYWTNWKAGDVISFDWAHLMHYTANASFNPRRILKITGITSDKNHWIFNNLNNNIISNI